MAKGHYKFSKKNFSSIYKKSALPPNIRKICKDSNSAFKKISVRERLMHLLAVRPRKREDILIFFNEDENHDLDIILEGVSHTKNSHHHLKKELWSDIQESWSFYSDLEKQLVKRNKLQNCLSSDDTTETMKPSFSSEIVSQEYKRPGYINTADGLQTKKLRISHFNKPSDPMHSTPNSSCPKNVASQRDTNHDQVPKDDSKHVFNLDDILLLPDFQNRPKLNSAKDRSNVSNIPVGASALQACATGSTHVTTKADSSVEVDETDFPVNGGSSSDCSEYPTARRMSEGSSNNSACQRPFQQCNYVTITSMEQRMEYKKDFIQYYSDFKNIQLEVQPAIFQLHLDLRGVWPPKEKCASYEKIRRETLHEYAFINDRRFKEKVGRYFQLLDGLRRIKYLICKYDEKVSALQ